MNSFKVRRYLIDVDEIDGSITGNQNDEGKMIGGKFEGEGKGKNGEDVYKIIVDKDESDADFDEGNIGCHTIHTQCFVSSNFSAFLPATIKSTEIFNMSCSCSYGKCQ